MHAAFAKHNRMRKDCENGRGTQGSEIIYFFVGKKGTCATVFSIFLFSAAVKTSHQDFIFKQFWRETKG